MAVLIAQPARIPIADPKTGMITREWGRYLDGLHERSGGVLGQSTTELAESAFDDAGTEEHAAALYALADGIGQHPIAADAAPLEQSGQSEICALREEVALLRQQINDIKQGLQA